MLIIFNENENNDTKTIIPSNIVNHIAIAMSVKIIAIRYFPHIVQPYSNRRDSGGEKRNERREMEHRQTDRVKRERWSCLVCPGGFASSSGVTIV